ncbi:hypothetical protein BFO_0686 [Tannerella forsythia 92A2]|uniref:Uncharacterized protein n=1 Tax=Tannerella forsythia (strain ATCC 43037 / JCM 10827 / CCUG 21028 A / KCTC 5666 / FDC 338) TaxID=203275 RepID=G8UMW8_TANFA|nr:hypothetical protein BFO_0686 [Tannerella forsythia 92A2]
MTHPVGLFINQNKYSNKNNRKSQYEWSPTQTTSKKEEI